MESASAMPQASFNGEWLHRDLYEMAADAFHVCQDHRFFDGNKRTALASALVFMDINQIDLEDTQDRLYAAMIEIASGSLSKLGMVEVLRLLAEET